MAFDPYHAAICGGSTSACDRYPRRLNGSCDGWIEEAQRQERIEARVSRDAEDAIDESEARYRAQLAACDLDDVLGVTKENE